MKPSTFFRGALAGAVAGASLSVAVSAVEAQGVVARPLGPILARSRDSLGANLIVRALANGGAVVDDASKRRLLFFDSTLAKPVVIADSAAGATSYGSRPAGLIAYRGDSSLFVDPLSSSFLVVDPGGKVARVMSAPRTQDVFFLASPLGGVPAFDNKGRLLYRGIARNTAPIVFSANGTFVPPIPPDSAPILRVDLATRKLDTVVWIRLPKVRLNPIALPTGGMSITTVVDPLPVTDEWAVLSDGSLAIVKGRDYHVELVNADGTRTVGQKLVFDWQRLTDDERVAVADSALKVAEAARTAALGASAARPATGTAAAAPPPPPLMALSPSELPDYRPAFKTGSARGDDAGNLWVMTTAPKPPHGGLQVDVINAKGELVDRIELPPGRSLAAIGPNGTVYLTARDATGMYLERAKLR